MENIEIKTRLFNYNKKGYGFCSVLGQKYFFHCSTLYPRPGRGEDLNGQEIVVTSTEGTKIKRAITLPQYKKEKEKKEKKEKEKELKEKKPLFFQQIKKIIKDKNPSEALNLNPEISGFKFKAYLKEFKIETISSDEIVSITKIQFYEKETGVDIGDIDVFNISSISSLTHFGIRKEEEYCGYDEDWRCDSYVAVGPDKKYLIQGILFLGLKINNQIFFGEHTFPTKENKIFFLHHLIEWSEIEKQIAVTLNGSDLLTPRDEDHGYKSGIDSLAYLFQL